MENELLQLLNLIIERDRLSRVRTVLRSRFNRSRKECASMMEYIRPSRLSCSHNLQKIEKFKSACLQYKKACDDLHDFTRKNSEFRKKMKAKYKTHQTLDGSNHVTALRFTVDEVEFSLDINQMKKIVLDEEINRILLG